MWHPFRASWIAHSEFQNRSLSVSLQQPNGIKTLHFAGVWHVSLQPNLITSWQKRDPSKISAEARLRRPEPTRRAEESHRISNDFIVINITNICFLTWPPPLSRVSHLFSALSRFESILLQTKHRLIIGAAGMLFSSQSTGNAIRSFKLSCTKPGRRVAAKACHWFTAFQRWLKKASCLWSILPSVGLNMSDATAAAIVATEQGRRGVGRFMIACIFYVTVTLSPKYDCPPTSSNRF